ncbi:MAG: amino acid adenylation domain-containing protein [Candidatus Tectimicrobiota bacterium]
MAGGLPLCSRTILEVADIERWLREHIASRLDILPDDLDSAQSLLRYGLDSLVAIELVADLEDWLGCSLPLTLVWDYPTITALAPYLASLASALPPRPAALPSASNTPEATAHLPLSHGQQALWLLQQQAPDNPAYNIACALRIVGSFDLLAWQAALQQLVARHPALRTTFPLVHGQPVQHIASLAAVSLQVEEVSDWPQAHLQAYLRTEAHRPMSLERGPLFRVYLLRRAPQEHVLLLVMHHIITDFWSFEVLVHELGLLYSAQQRGVSAILPTLAQQYTDYVAWQRHLLTQPSGEAAATYWEQQLAGHSPVLQLPTDYPRPALRSWHGDAVTGRLSVHLTQQLKRLSQACGSTLYTTLLSVFALLLHRYTGQEDLLIGSPMACRSQTGWAGVLGYFANTVVLRTRLEGNPAFCTLLAQVQQTVLAALEHQHYPFPVLVERLQPARDPSRTPLFQVMFVLQQARHLNDRALAALALGNATAHFELAGLAMEVIPLPQQAAQCDLSLSLAEVEGSLVASLQYSTALFTAERMQRLLGHFAQLLEGVVAAPQRLIGQFSLLTPAEQRLLQTWNATQVPYALAHSILPHLEAQAERTPEQPAVTCGNRHYTYRELHQRANQLAHHLRRLGVGPDVLVGVYMERSLEMVVALLGILKAGGAYVPLEPSYPAARLRFMLADAAVSLVLTQAHLQAGLPDQAAPVRCLDSDWPLIARECPENPPPCTRPDDLAYVIYTSGSTGQPKGVLNTHRGLCNRLLWMQQAYPLTAADSIAQKTPFSFDVSVWEFFWPLMTGARLVVARPEGHRDSAYLVQLITTEQLTVLHFVPSMLQIFLETPGLEHCTSLRHVICSGEVLPAHVQERFFTRLRQVALHNLYGPTEAAIDVTCWTCQPGSQQRTVPIGRPIANTQIHLLDTYLQPVPVGVPAELHIAGTGLARGYLKRPELTASRFIAPPEGLGVSTRLYKTGDLAQYRPDGTLEYLGRLDQQVKWHGVRLELGEIESLLGQHPGVREAVAMLREDTPGEPTLVAYVVPQGNPPDSRELRAFLQAALPAPMVPSLILCLDAMPLSANGKIARQLLPAPRHRPQVARAYVAPRTGTESRLADIWARVLGLERVGVLENFFDLGGDSIRSLRLCAEARLAGLQLSIQALYQYQTIAALSQAQAVPCCQTEQVMRSAPFSLLTEADRARLPAGVVDAYPLATLQAGMLFHSAWEATTAMYHDVFSFHLALPYDAKALQQAAQQLAARHPVLRTAFDLSRYSTPLQLVYSDVHVPVHLDNWQHYPPAEQEQRLTAWRESEKRRPFVWQSAPLWRLFVHRRSASTLQLTLSFHHAILDGWSVATLLTEFFTLYLAQIGAVPPSVTPPPAALYGDFIAREQQVLQMPSAQAYWQAQLADAPSLRLPCRPDLAPETCTADTRHLTVAFSAALSQKLRQLAQQASVPLRTVLLTAHLRVLSLLSGESEVLTGVVTHNRPETLDSERALGLFLNTLPWCMRLADGSWTDLLQQTFAQEQAHAPFRHYPFGAMQRQSDRPALVQTVFDYTHFHLYAQLSGHPELRVLDMDIFEQTNFPLYMRFMHDVADTHLALHLHYEASQFSRAYVQMLADAYLRVLQSMVQQPAARHTQVCLLAPAETERLLHTWNTTQADYPQTRCLHELFAAQAARTPDAVALLCGTRQLTYRDLEQQANQLAHALQRLGVGPDVPVGLCVERSLPMVVGLLGILKAGGAYLPLDPNYPRERLRFMLQDARPTVLVTQEALRSCLPSATGARVLCLDSDWSSIAQESRITPPCAATAEHAAYVMYTSGSTGEPKAVLGLHRGAVNRCTWMWQAYPFQADEVGCQKTSLNFVDSVWELFGPLLQGVPVLLVPNEVVREPQQLIAALAQHRVSRLVLVPALLRMLLDSAPDLGARLPHLTIWMSSGEELPLELARRFRQCLPDRLLLNLYGSSEVAADVTCYDTRQLNEQHTSVPIGRPLANTQIYLLDAHLQPVPLGAAGEVYVGGAGLARGYLCRPALTAERFIAHPFDARPGARLYKTGDMARYLPDGNLLYLGRLDQQVKLRGMRLELGEISTVLAQHPEVQQALATIRDDHNGDKRLVAYVTTHPDTAPSTHALRTFLQTRLPEYMLPTAFVRLAQFPRTANGKIDRLALPAPTATVRPGAPAPTLAPRTPLEHTLAEIWSTLLGVSQVGIYDNFFALGGHSLLAMQLLGRLQERLGYPVALHTLLQHPTLAGLASALAEPSSASLGDATLVPLQPLGSRLPLFCLPAAGGEVLGYRLLAELLGPERPVYGLQQGALTDALPRSLSALASSYSTAMRQQQPSGPYGLLGWSFGGVLALAVAHCLEQQGQQVAFVGLLDTLVHTTAEEPDPLLSLILACGSALSQALMHLAPGAQQTLRNTLRPLTTEARLQTLLAWGEANGVPCPALPPAHLVEQAACIQSHLGLLKAHRVQPIQAPIHAWWAGEGLAAVQQRPVWAHYTSAPVRSTVLAGNHWSLLQLPHVRTLAVQLQAVLQTLA